MTTTTQEKITKKKSKKSKPKHTKKKIRITGKTFDQLRGFVDGTYREIYAEPEELYARVPDSCPFCHWATGYEYVQGPLAVAPLRYVKERDCYRQNRVFLVQCIQCGQNHKITEVWDVY